jgi:YHS domain-containing protein
MKILKSFLIRSRRQTPIFKSGLKAPLSINPEHTPGLSPPSFASRMRTAKPGESNGLISLSLLIFISFSPTPCFSQGEIIIRTYLFKGFHEGYQPGPKRVGNSSDNIIKVPVLYDPDNPDIADVDSIKSVIRSVYRITYATLLTSAYAIWDGKKENINEAVLNSIDLYPIQLFPTLLTQNTLKLRIEALKFECLKISYFGEISRVLRAIDLKGNFEIFAGIRRFDDYIGAETWLDRELTLAMNSTALMALPTKDRSLYLSIQIYRRNDTRMDAGLVGNTLLSCSLGGMDPVCRKKLGQGDGFLPENKPKASLNYQGHTFFFCSEECLEKFKKAPEKYLNRVKFRDVNPESDSQNAVAGFFLRPQALIIPKYPEDFRQDNREGIVPLELAVDDKGSVREVRFLQSAAPVFEETLQNVLRQWNFNSTTKSGKPTPAIYPAHIIFGPKPNEMPEIPKDQSQFPAAAVGILNPVADYCAKLENAALDFICREKIVEKFESDRQFEKFFKMVEDPVEKRGHYPGVLMGSGPLPRQENSFTYDYQVIRKDGRIQEKRVLLVENETYGRDDNAYPKTKRFYINKAIYGPVGLLNRAVQRLCDYRLLKDETWKGRKAFVISIRPTKPDPGKPVYGEVWVDKEDSSVLKLNIDAESLSGYERLSADFHRNRIRYRKKRAAFSEPYPLERSLFRSAGRSV